jgi:polysaccharide biosynthesis/export protein
MCTIGMEFTTAAVSNYIKRFQFFTRCVLPVAGLFLFSGLIAAQSQNSATNSSQTEERNGGSDSANQPPVNPNPSRTAPGEKTPAPVAPGPSAGGAPVDTSTYKIGPQDSLRVVVWREQDFSGIYTVHSDGKITLPLVGDIQAGGLTAEEVGKNITTALSKLIVKPLVTVTVQQVLSKKYYMDGEIGRPGEYPLAAPTTVLEAISLAGGLRDFANGKKIYILRGSERLKFNYKDVIKGKNLEQNIPLQSGDHIVVP